MRAHRAWWLLLAPLGLVPFLREFSDPDIWFHLTIGREIFSRAAIPQLEFYIFPSLGAPAHFPAAGYGLIQYLLFRLAGLPALTVFNAATFLATLYLLARAARVSCAAVSWTAALLAASVVLWGLNVRFVYRPETMLFLFLALELLLLESWLRSGRASLLWGLPILTWAITLLHTTWIFLVLVYGAYVLHWLWERRREPAAPQGTTRRLVPLLFAGAGMCVLPIVNPYGIDQLMVLLQGVFSGWGALVSGGGALIEYLPIHQTDYLPHFVFLLACTAASWTILRRVRLCDVLLVGGFGVLAALAARNIGLFAMACFLPTARALGSRARGWVAGRRRALIIALALASGTLAVRSEGTWGYGVDARTAPVSGARAISELLPPCNVFNFFHFGGFLAWELGALYRVAVDGHFVRPNAADPLHDRFFTADPGWRGIAAHYGVCAIVSPALLPHSARVIPLAETLASDPDWTLVAVEPAAMTFVRAGLAAGAVPLPKKLVWQQMRSEAAEVLRRHPTHERALSAMRRADERLRLDADRG